MNIKANINIKDILLYALMVVLTLIVSYITVSLGATYGIVLFVFIIGGALAVISIINFKFGFYLSLATGFVIFWIGRFLGDTLPIGLIIDMQINSTFLGLIIHKMVRKEKFLQNADHPITYFYLLYVVFLIIEFFNPNMGSSAGWILIFRKFIQFLMIYMVAVSVFDSLESIRFYIKFWIIGSLLAGLYGCYQEWFGFLNFESNWVFSSKGRAALYSLDNGNFRKFSSLSDPSSFGITMACSALIFFIFAFGKKNFLQKMLLFLAVIFVILGIGYSGTRTAYFIFFAGGILYILMTITNKSTLIIACAFLVGVIFILWGPIYGNPTINRVRSTFNASDASVEVRDLNRALIQPYIHSHPIGGGLATSGVQGKEYNPGHYLATFPPDSGFMKTAVETGWIGFFFQCLIYCIALLSGIKVFYRSENSIIKNYALIATVTIFSFVVAQYGQVSIGQVPDCFLYYPLLGVIVRLNAFMKTINETQ